MARPYRMALVGGVLSVLWPAGEPTPAEAKPRARAYRVRIESQPPGATVYLDSKESEPLGTTPLFQRLAAGSHTLIVELDGYVSQVQDIKIRKHRRVQRIAIRLGRIDQATIEVVADRGGQGRDIDLKGARILVDGRDAGVYPDLVKVPAGPHQIEVVKEGYKTFEDWVEVAEGEWFKVEAMLIPVAARRVEVQAAGRTAAAAGREDDEPPPEPGDVPVTERPVSVDRAVAAATPRRVPFFEIGAGLEVGARRFRPNSDDVQGLRRYDAGGVPMIRLAADVNPLAFSPSKWISGWGLYASYGRATPLDSAAKLTVGEEIQEVDVPTEWSELDLGVRYRYRFDPSAFVGLQVGYGTHTFTFDFSADTMELAGEVPDVAYKFWRVGLEGRYGFGRFAALGSGGTRLVNSIGNLGARFTKTDILGLNLSAGLAAAVTDSIEARLVARYDHFAHEYTPMDSNPASTAVSGVDQFYGAVLSALYHY